MNDLSSTLHLHVKVELAASADFLPIYHQHLQLLQIWHKEITYNKTLVHYSSRELLYQSTSFERLVIGEGRRPKRIF